MSPRLIQSFGYSLFLHAGLLLIAVFFAVRRSEPILAPQPFVLVDEPAAGRDAPMASPSEALLRVPTLPPRRAEPAMAVAPAAVPAMAPATLEKPLRSAAVTNATRSAPHVPTSSRMTYQEFHNSRGKADAPARGPVPSAPRVAETYSFSGQAVAPSREASVSVTRRFVPALLSDLRQAFVGSGVPGADLAATVEFRLNSDGKLSAVRIVRSSGAPRFDAAVVAAFASVGARGFEAADVGKPYSVEFRAKE
jgi:TonB family protein